MAEGQGRIFEAVGSWTCCSAVIRDGAPVRASHAWKREPQEERKAVDYREAAEDSLDPARVLAGQGGISDQDFLQRMARSDELVDHDGESAACATT
jgi:hypothetical protein